MAFKNFFKFGKKNVEENEELEKIDRDIDKEEVEKETEETGEDKNFSKSTVSNYIEKPKPLKDRLAAPKKGFFGKLKEIF